MDLLIVRKQQELMIHQHLLVPTGTSDPDDECSPFNCDFGFIPEGFTPDGDGS